MCDEIIDLLFIKYCLKNMLDVICNMYNIHLIDKIDANLLKSIVLENFKSSNIQNCTKVNFLHLRINQCLIALLNQPFEKSVINCPSNSTSCIRGLLNVLAFGDPFCSYFDPWFAEGFDHSRRINTAKSCSLEGIN